MAKAPTAISIALIGDYDPQVPAHRAIPLALGLAAADLGVAVQYDWLHTSKLPSPPDAMPQRYQGVWCVPASPYANTAGAIAAIRFARENHRPYLGTCGGFQHALLEFAENVLRIPNPRHAELDPQAPHPLIAPLACPLVEASETIFLVPGSRIARAYGRTEILEQYRCRFGLSREFESLFENAPLHPVGREQSGEIRAMELTDHPFFLATRFQPEHAALRGELPPLVRAFIQASIGQNR